MEKEVHVLIVDDDVSFTDSLSDILQEKGYKAVAVNSGQEAVDRVKENLPFGQRLLTDFPQTPVNVGKLS